jgi:hypothetical protein
VAIFGIEGISKFENYRKFFKLDKKSNTDIPDLFITFEGLVKKLRASNPKHYKRFIQFDDACEELDLHDANDQGGQDFKWAQNTGNKKIHTLEWKQGTIEAKLVIESLTVDNANHVVLDPFMGPGTTGVAVLE